MDSWPHSVSSCCGFTSIEAWRVLWRCPVSILERFFGTVVPKILEGIKKLWLLEQDRRKEVSVHSKLFGYMEMKTSIQLKLHLGNLHGIAFYFVWCYQCWNGWWFGNITVPPLTTANTVDFETLSFHEPFYVRFFHLFSCFQISQACQIMCYSIFFSCIL